MADSLGRTDKAFAIVSMTLKQKWNIATSTMQATLIEIGKELKKVFVPILIYLTDKLRDTVQWIRSLTESQKKLILTFTGIVTVVGPVLIVLGSLTQAIGFVIGGLARFGLSRCQGCYEALRDRPTKGSKGNEGNSFPIH
jgi:choline-glycine betaine transporter